MKHLRLMAGFMLIISLLAIGCSQEPNAQAPVGEVEFKFIDNLNAQEKTINPSLPSGNVNITHYKLEVEHSNDKNIKTSGIVAKNTRYTVTNLVGGRYNITAKALVAKNENPQSFADYIEIAEIKLTNHAISAQAKTVTLNFSPETLIQGQSGDITINVTLPGEYANKDNVTLKYTITKALEGKITNTSGAEVQEAVASKQLTVDKVAGEVTLVLPQEGGDYKFAPGAYDIKIELLNDAGEVVKTAVDNMRLFANVPATGTMFLLDQDIVNVQLNVSNNIGDNVQITNNEYVVIGNTVKIEVAANSEKTVAYEWFMNGKLLAKDTDYTVAGNEYTFNNVPDGRNTFMVLVKEEGTAMGVGSKSIIVNMITGNTEIIEPKPVSFGQIDPEIGNEDKIVIGYIEQQTKALKNEPVQYTKGMTLATEYLNATGATKELYTATELGLTPVYVTWLNAVPRDITTICVGGGHSSNDNTENYKHITEVYIAPGATKIGRYGFCHCQGLKSITIPNSVISIGENAFKECSALTSITIPKGVTSIGNSAFKGCTGLMTITVDPANISYKNEGNCLIETATNKLLKGFNDSVIPKGVTSIDDSAFKGCTGLTSITIPEGVESIDDNAFDGCTGLTSITIPEGVTSIGNYAFKGCTGLTSITIPNSVISIGDNAFDDCTGLTSITIPEGVTSIGNSAFDDCTGLMTITVDPANISYKNEGNCLIETATNKLLKGFNDSVIPEGVTSIDNSAFQGCTGLTSITIPEGVTSIGMGAFHGCTGLTSITIPEGVTSIGNYAFMYCYNLTTITYNGTQEQWNAIAKESSWNMGTGNYTIHCTDGNIAKQ